MFLRNFEAQATCSAVAHNKLAGMGSKKRLR
jgi:hypothetical protein